LSTEHVAARAFLDEEHKGPQYVSVNDKNAYTLGSIGGHNVVIALLPDGEYGTDSASRVASDMLHTFPSIRIGLMVGIGGGVPSKSHDIRLGDVVVGTPSDGHSGVMQYDFGKTMQDQSFRATRFLNQPPTILRSAVAHLRSEYEIAGHHLEESIKNIIKSKPRLRRRFARPAQSSDRLYTPTAVHPPVSGSCTTVCDDEHIILRPEREEDEDNPAIHYGLIASGNQVMKDAVSRDILAEKDDVICFEMEAAGLMNHFPCLVVRGICDYADSHKNKEWQAYAAMTAAAYVKDLLRCIAPSQVEAEDRIVDMISGKSANVLQ
jgi:nucleoside phosphorylase